MLLLLPWALSRSCLITTGSDAGPTGTVIRWLGLPYFFGLFSSKGRGSARKVLKSRRHSTRSDHCSFVALLPVVLRFFVSLFPDSNKVVFICSALVRCYNFS